MEKTELNDKELKQVTGGAESFTCGEAYHIGDTCPECGGILVQGFLPHMVQCSECGRSFDKEG